MVVVMIVVVVVAPRHRDRNREAACDVQTDERHQSEA